MVRLGNSDSTFAGEASASAETSGSENEGYEPEEMLWEEEPQESGPARGRWLAAALVLALLGWTAIYGLVHLDEMRDGATGSLWLSWAAEWIIPALLLVLVWQLAVRNGAGEQARFANAGSSPAAAEIAASSAPVS